MKKFVCIFAALSAFVYTKTQAQQTFTLVDVNKMVLDPAFTAIDTSFKNDASLYAETYKNSIITDYINNSFIGTYQMSLDKIHSGVGVMFNYNYWNLTNQEIFNQVATKLYYRYTILNGLSIGVDAGFVNINNHYQFPTSGMGFIYPNIPYNNSIINNLDFDGGVGILYQYKSIYAGFSIDHITKPEQTFPAIDNNGSLLNIQAPMMNYSGLAYNWIVGGSIPFGKCGINLSAAYRSLILNLNATLEAPHFFAGFSTLLENYNNNNIPDMFTSIYYYDAFMAGIKACHNKVKISLAYNFQPPVSGAYRTPSIEGGVSYSF